MKNYKIFIIIALAVPGFFIARAQYTRKPLERKKIIHKGTTYLADGVTGSGTISKKRFDSLIALPVISRDSSGVERPVIEFVFSYAERALYEDSTGRPVVMTDYFSTTCPGGKLSDDWVKVIRDKSKKGDTAYIDEVTAVYPDTLHTRFYTTPVKLVITE